MLEDPRRRGSSLGSGQYEPVGSLGLVRRERGADQSGKQIAEVVVGVVVVLAKRDFACEPQRGLVGPGPEAERVRAGPGIVETVGLVGVGKARERRQCRYR